MKIPSPETMWADYGVNWWWRDLFKKFDNSKKWVPLEYDLKYKYLRSAFLYELGARVNGKFEFEKPWINLDKNRWRELFRRWPMDTGTDAWENGCPGHNQTRPGWTPYQNQSWDLNLNDETLVAAFREFITLNRAALKISKPRANAGRKMRMKYRGFSWLWIELMDVRKNVVGTVLGDTERSQVSKARKLYQTSI